MNVLFNWESMVCRIEEGKYFKKLSKEDIESKKENLLTTLLLSELEQKRKIISLKIKDSAKPLLEDNKLLIEVIKLNRKKRTDESTT